MPRKNEQKPKKENETLAAIEKIARDIGKSPYHPSSMHDLVSQNFKELEDMFTRQGILPGLPTGFKLLDDVSGGLQNSQLVVVAGRPGMGKTSFAHNVAAFLSAELKVPVLVFSLEMTRGEVVMRMVSSEAKVDSRRMRSGYLGEHDWPKLTVAAGRLAESPIYVIDQPAVSSLSQIEECSREMKKIAGIKLIIVDYLQLVRLDPRRETRDQEISEITRSLKALAMELGVPVVLLSQLNRKLGDRHGRRPRLDDLRDSGAIEEDADFIMFIYRDELYNTSDDNPEKGVAEFIVGKHKNGPTGVIKVAFLDKFTVFENLARIDGSKH